MWEQMSPHVAISKAGDDSCRRWGYLQGGNSRTPVLLVRGWAASLDMAATRLTTSAV